MSQPWQLAKAFKPRKSSRPILEQLPAVSTTELKISSIYKGKPANIKPLKIPGIEAIKRSLTEVEFHFRPLHRGQKGRVEAFRIKHWRVGYGIRHAFLCNTCGQSAIKLYLYNHTLLCRFCCNGRYVCEAISRQSRPQLMAMRIENLLTKPLWQRTRERLLKRFGPKLLRAQQAYGTQTRNLY